MPQNQPSDAQLIQNQTPIVEAACQEDTAVQNEGEKNLLENVGETNNPPKLIGEVNTLMPENQPSDVQ